MSWTINSVMPLTKACSRRLATGHARHSNAEASSSLPTLFSRYASAISSSLSVPSLRRLRITSSTASRSFSGTLS
ncbi:Uncharacterised protein [Vibrio cholerae]|nr:Uncharacterised protein [Vibrio cholerae]CSI37094.1 Uncharacterised protein [Vibrio cholerae]CSI64620.1 Uncharacterised protein [Vibrio cholerae]